MNRPFVRKRPGEPEGPPPGHPTTFTPVTAGRACCCLARPVVEVLMPATADRPHPVELLLCGHHYRISQEALERAGAHVFELDGTPPEAFLRPLPRHSRHRAAI